MAAKNDDTSRVDPRRHVANRVRAPGRHWELGERPYHEWVRVYARIRWRRGGVTWERGIVKQWTDREVCVYLHDVPWVNLPVWLDPEDVIRR